MGNVGVIDSLAEFFSAVDFAGDFDISFLFVFDARGLEVTPEASGGVVAVFLENVDLGGEAAEDGKEAGVFLRVGDELAAIFGLDEELGEFGGGELESDFGELSGLVFAEVFGEVVLEAAGEVCGAGEGAAGGPGTGADLGGDQAAVRAGAVSELARGDPAAYVAGTEFSGRVGV